MPAAIVPTSRLRADLDALAEHLEGLRIGLDTADAPRRRALRDAVVWSIRGYLQPRLADPDGPLLVAIFGPTGSGKSTLVNALAGTVVSPPGVVRPTTDRAVVWDHHERASTPYPALDSTGPVERVRSADPLLGRLIIVDTPDVDSYVESHRRQTERILVIADAVVYVTTPQRYADAVPWSLLRALAERRVPLLVVANRMTRGSVGAVTDLASLLRIEGVKAITGTGEVFEIREQHLRDGLLPKTAVRAVRTQLEGLALAHDRAVQRTMGGALASALSSAGALASEVRTQDAEADALKSVVAGAFRREGEALGSLLEAGGLVTGEVLERWQRLVGVGDLARVAARGAARVRDAISRRATPRPTAVRRVESEVRERLTDLAVSRVRRAVDAVGDAWDLEPAGAALLTPVLRRPAECTPRRAEEEIDAWLDGLVELVRDRGRSRFRLARAASFGVNAAAVLLLLSVFVSTAGLSGAEVGVLAGAATAQQAVLEHVFGGAAARLLADRARRDLESRFARVLDEDAERFVDAVDAAADPLSTAAGLESMIVTVRRTAEEAGRGRAG